jgi:signal peptidase I
MIQFLRLSDSLEAGGPFSLPAGSNAVRFFLKRVGYLALFVYGTLFLAVAIPFDLPPVNVRYFIGAMVIAVFLLRFVNHIVKYIQYAPGSITVTAEAIEVRKKDQCISLPRKTITYCEINVLGNIVIRCQHHLSVAFPYALLSDDDRSALKALCIDMAPKRTRFFGKVWELFDAVAVALLLAVHIIQFIVQAYFIPTGSMEDTLRIYDRLFVEKITFGPVIPAMAMMEKPVHLSFLSLRSLKRGDIVIFQPPPPNDPTKDYIKRCVALPGDHFEVKDGAVWINKVRQDESYVKGITTLPDERTNSINNRIVPPGQVVVLGDNREISSDSRFWGYLEIEQIKGKAFILFWNSQDLRNGDFTRLGLIR